MRARKKLDTIRKGHFNGDFVNECKGYDWITKHTFESHVQDITLKLKIKYAKIFNRIDQLLPCDLDELGCKSTSLDPYAYNWKAPENCILSGLKRRLCKHAKERQSLLHS